MASGVTLNWDNKDPDVERLTLPFQVIESINEPRVKQQRLGSQTPNNYPDDWSNYLVWGDNKYVISSLMPQLGGEVDLIYIDPPFATGDDFSAKVQVGSEEFTKSPTAIEKHIYKDTWGEGYSSYLQMMYERLVLMRDLLADDGSIFVHSSWHTGHFMKLLLDEIFGRQNFRNEIIWHYYNKLQGNVNYFPRNHDVIFWYSKSDDYSYETQYTERDEPVEQIKRVWDSDKGKLVNAKNDDGNVIYETRTERTVDDVWRLSMIQPADKTENRGYPTQKPEEILERIIGATTEEGDIVADFFCGSGTAGAVAERMGRRWIMSDVSKFGVHTARKRLLDLHNYADDYDQLARPFTVYNLGTYQKRKFIENGHPPQEDYLQFILNLYNAEVAEGYEFIHGQKGDRAVHISDVESIVMRSEVEDAAQECVNFLGATKLDILGWEFQMGLEEEIQDIEETYGIEIRPRLIPDSTQELKSSDEDIQFYDLNYIEVDVDTNPEKNEATIELEDFVIGNPEYVPEDVREELDSFSDYIDYWEIDFDHREEDHFRNMWQDFRTRADRSLDTKARHRYDVDGHYTILVKVIDILGNDTNKLVEIEL